MASTGRNDPCPCGSGRKYKKCCLPREQAAQMARAKQPSVGAKRILWEQGARVIEALGDRLGRVVDTYAVADPDALHRTFAQFPRDREYIVEFRTDEYVLTKPEAPGVLLPMGWLLLHRDPALLEVRCEKEEEADWAKEWLARRAGSLLSFRERRLARDKKPSNS